jgi:hypothetical protein
VVLAVAYGMVCGAMMLAGEEEGRTNAFLDGLPVLRSNIWLTKAVVGAFLILTQGLVLAGIVTGLGVQLAKDVEPVHWFWMLPSVALEAFAWGLFGSSLARSVMGGIALGLVPFLVTWMVGAGATGGHDVGALLAGVAFAVAGLSLSAAFYTRSDWERSPAVPRNRISARDTTTKPATWEVLLWLAARQSPGGVLVMALLVFLVGLWLTKVGLIFWPITTLFAGVLCGTAVFRGEQADESYRFLGDQRLPVAWVWAWKNAYWLLIAAVLTGLTFAAGLLHEAAGASRPTLYSAWEVESLLRNWETPLVLVGLWLLHGFAVGQLCTLFWRKTVVALVMALTLGTVVSVVWLPSILSGGLHVWQAYAVPVVLLATSLLLQRAWVSDRLTSWKPLAGLAFAGLLAVGSMGGGLEYRVAEVPEVGDPFDVVEFMTSLSAPEQKEAGNRIRQALQELQERQQEVTQALRPPAPPIAGGGRSGRPGRHGPHGGCGRPVHGGRRNGRRPGRPGNDGRHGHARRYRTPGNAGAHLRGTRRKSPARRLGPGRRRTRQMARSALPGSVGGPPVRGRGSTARCRRESAPAFHRHSPAGVAEMHLGRLPVHRPRPPVAGPGRGPGGTGTFPRVAGAVAAAAPQRHGPLPDVWRTGGANRPGGFGPLAGAAREGA